MARHSFGPWFLLLVLAGSPGCGASKSPAAPAPIALDTRLQQDFPRPGLALPAAGGALPTGQGTGLGATEGLQILEALRVTLSQVQGFDSEIRSYTQGHYKQGNRVEELRKATTQARLVWLKPLKLRAEVIQTSNALLVGAALVTTDGTNVTARAKGLLGLIPFKMLATDPKLGNNRNHRFTQNNPKSQLERLTNRSAVWTVVGDSQVEGTPIKLIEVVGVNRLDKEVSREIVGIDPKANTLRKLIMYADTTRVAEHTFLKFRWNPKLGADTFSI